MKEGDVVDWRIRQGYRVWLKLESVSPYADASGQRDLTWQINGERWFLHATDDEAMEADGFRREKVKPSSGKGQISAGLPGVCVDVRVKEGDVVSEGDPLFVLSAMKMETTIKAPVSGLVK